ncbi:MAG: alkaline phosphatase family protein [Clostridia bacterium]|nr:alkaline phosphatase family protein [Clostridia bacterium]
MDPKLTRRLVDEGRMPNVKQYITRGSARADLRQLGCLPTITPPCWTSLATGAYPGTHGITCYWRQSPKSLDAVVYNMDSRNCTAEQLWNVTAESGRKTLVWHWPGSSWPPSSDSPNLDVVDGTQPGSVNMGIAQMDWEKIVYASADIPQLGFQSRSEKQAGVGCNITDLSEVMQPEEEDEMMELWWGDKSREGGEIRTYVRTFEDTEIMIGSKVGYDVITSPLIPATGWKTAPEDALEFTILVSSEHSVRPALVLKNKNGLFDRVAVYSDKQAAQPLAELSAGQMICGKPDILRKNGQAKPAVRLYKLMELDEETGELRLWISNALDITNDTLWHPKALYKQVLEEIGYVPPVSLIGGEDDEIASEIFEPSWDLYNQWQADCLNTLIEKNQYEVVFSHLHNVDCAGHQIWHLGKTLEPWDYTDETVYQGLIERIYEQTDRYLGRFLHLLDEGWTILIVSDHGLIVGENVPPLLGEYGGLNVPVMEQLGYTVMTTDAAGNTVVDWEKTRAVQIRSNYIYINLKGRDAHGIVDPADKYSLEEQIISDLYNYRNELGERVVGIAVRNHDAELLGVSGPECGDIYFSIRERFGRLHGDTLTTAEGYFGTSVSPIFIAAGTGIKENHTTKRTIRQVDIAPTAAALLGVRFPAQCEGAPIYQILSEDL